MSSDTMRVPIDTATGSQAGGPVHEDHALVLVGWLVTLPDGLQTRMGLDKARAVNYATQQHATIEAMFVFRAGTSYSAIDNETVAVLRRALGDI
jgi:hypothetical protein